MKTPTVLRRRRQNDENEQALDGIPADPDEPNEGIEWTGRSAAATKAATLGLWAFLACGPAALVLALMSGSDQIPVAASTANADQQSAAGRVAVSAFAEDFVTTWLSTRAGQEQRLGRFVGGASSISLPERPWTVTNTATAAASQESDDLWAVTIAASVKGQRGAPVRRYFQVPIKFSAGDLVAQSLPAPVPSPPLAAPAALDYPYRANMNGPVALAAQDFLSALITGNGDVSRYIAPTAFIEAIAPPPYTRLTIETVRIDQNLEEDLSADVPQGAQLRLLVDATARDTKITEISVQYALTMSARDGRWEVAQIDPVPMLTAPTDPPDMTSAPTPSTATP